MSTLYPWLFCHTSCGLFENRHSIPNRVGMYFLLAMIPLVRNDSTWATCEPLVLLIECHIKVKFCVCLCLMLVWLLLELKIEKRKQAWTSCAVSQFIFHGCEMPRLHYITLFSHHRRRWFAWTTAVFCQPTGAAFDRNLSPESQTAKAWATVLMERI